MKFIKNTLLSLICLALMFVSGTFPVFAAADVIRPYVYGFGSADDGSEGVEALIQAGDLKHLTFTDSTGHKLSYYAHIPKQANGEVIHNLPLVVYMHGYSDGGADNDNVLRYHNAVLYQLIKDQNNPNRQAIILVPQTPNALNSSGESDWFKDQWVGIKGSDKWSQWNRTTWNMDETPRTDNLSAVVELIKTVQQNTYSDVDRAYVTGISMGGYATWDLISRSDDHMFAAAAPICGVGDLNKIENMKNTPIRTFHGSLDTTIRADSTRRMYQALRKYGNITYTEYPSENHSAWNAAYSNTIDDDYDGVSNINDLISWMFNQSRNGTLDGKIDKDPLRQIYKEAKAIVRSDYEDEVWMAIQTELLLAASYLEDEEASLQDIHTCIETFDALLKETIASNTSKYDINIPLSNITAGSDYPSYDNAVANVFDNNIHTIWHTNWDVDYMNTDQHYITFELPSGTIANALRYLPRQDASINGVVLAYEMYAGDSIEHLEKIAEGNWEQDKTWKIARFPETSARFIRFKSTKALSDNNRLFASAAEVHLANVDDAEFVQPCTIASEMWNDNPDNTWVFTGGKSVAGGYEESYGVRNYVGQFEEYVRYTTTSHQVNRMQRYVVNTGKAGRTITEVNHSFDTIVKQFDPRALVIMIGEEDYQAKDTGVAAFKTTLRELIKKALAMRNDEGYIVIQTPYAQRDADKNYYAGLYAQAVQQVYAELSDIQKQNAMVIDHFKITNTQAFTETYVDENGYLNAKGHLEIAKEFTKKIKGNIRDFPVEEHQLKLVKTNTPEMYHEEIPEVTVSKDCLHIALSQEIQLLSDNWTYNLAMNGQQQSSEFENEVTINNLKQGQTYTLTITSSDGKHQLGVVTGTITTENEPLVKPVMQTDLNAKQQVIRELVEGDRPLTWLFIGDSITHGLLHTYGYDSIHQTFEKYIHGALGRVDDVVVNTAVSGATTREQEEQSLYRLDKYDADIVTIMLGTNDAYQNIPLQTYRRNLESIVDKSIAKGAAVVLRTPNPTRDGFVLDAYVNIIREVANAKGVIFVDHYAEWSKELETSAYLLQNDYWHNDAIHPNPNGQLNMTQSVIRGMGIAKDTSPMYHLAYEMPNIKEQSNIEVEMNVDQQRISVDWKKLAATYSAAFGTVQLEAMRNGVSYHVSVHRNTEDELMLQDLPAGAYEVRVIANLWKTSKTVTFNSKLVVINDPAIEIDPAITKAVLKGAIDKAETVSMNKLAPSVKAMIIQALAEAKMIYTDDSASYTQCLQAWLNLANALHYLDFVADKVTLHNLIIACENIDLNHYTEGVSAFMEALNNAKRVYGDDTVLQASIDFAYTQLATAREGLVKSEVDKTLLETIFAMITEEINDGKQYQSDEAWDNFQMAYQDAKRILGDASADNADVYACLQVLTNTYLAIRLLPDEALLEQLNAFIQYVMSTDLTQYRIEDVTTVLAVKARVEHMLCNTSDIKRNDLIALQGDIKVAIYILENKKIEISETTAFISFEKEAKTTIFHDRVQQKVSMAQPTLKKPIAKTGDSSHAKDIVMMLFVSGVAIVIVKTKKRKV